MIITVIWLTTAGIQATEQLQVLQTLTYFQIHMVYFSYVIVHLFVICVSYTCIFIKVRCSGHPQHHGAAGVRERKLTSTPFCCDYYIFIDLVFTCCERKSVGFSYPGILQPFLAVKVSYWHDHTSNLLCQFNSKSHNLRPADARIKSGCITTIPQESNSFKPGRSTSSKSLVQRKVSVLMTVTVEPGQAYPLDYIPGGGDSIYKKGRDARREFWNWPLRETNLSVARAFFDS